MKSFQRGLSIHLCWEPMREFPAYARRLWTSESSGETYARRFASCAILQPSRSLLYSYWRRGSERTRRYSHSCMKFLLKPLPVGNPSCLYCVGDKYECGVEGDLLIGRLHPGTRPAEVSAHITRVEAASPRPHEHQYEETGKIKDRSINAT